MGVVHRGIDEQSSTPVAIKTLQPTAFHSAEAHARLQGEASLANKLHYPGIARTLDFGVEGETPFLIMELVEGIELAEIIEQEDAAASQPERSTSPSSSLKPTQKLIITTSSIATSSRPM